MAWSSGFFNSVNGDRLYNAEQMSNIFKGLITDGVYESVGNKLVVEPNSGMTVQINTGRGWFGGKWANNDSAYLYTLEDSDVLLNRYCAVCVRTDTTDAERKAEPYFKYSEFATTPVKPVMERTETIKEYCLAYIYIRAGVGEITAADIEDTRHDTSLCGWVTGLIDQVDTSTLYKQWEAVFFEWFDNLEQYLDDNVEAKLVDDVLQLQGRTLKTTATLNSTAWSDNGGNYTQTIMVNGVTEDSDIVVAPFKDDEDNYIDMNCSVVSKGFHTITFECDNPYVADIGLEIIIFNINLLADVIIESVNNFTVTNDGNGAVTITA